MNDDPLIGQRLANYQIEGFLGQGGMAQVYFGHDVTLHRPVAIKVIDARYRGDPGYAKRFVSEARVVASWRHENIIQVYYADKGEDFYYFAMEYIDGMGVDVLLAQYGSEYALMPPDDVLYIGRAIASALDYAHKNGVIHRDVKPSNVLVSHDNRVVLADFGLALEIQQGTMGETFGTPHYIAPEQARRSADAVPQSDLYALGVILYEMLTGVVPFDDPSIASVVMQHMTEPPPSPRGINPTLNAETEAVLLKALEKEPEDRYQTGAELIAALEDALRREPSPGTVADGLTDLPPLPPSVAAQSPRTVSRLSVSERIALHLKETRARPPATGTRSAATPRRSPGQRARTARSGTKPRGASAKWNSNVLILALFGVVAVLVVAVVLFGSRGNGDNPETEPLPTRISGLATSTALPVATNTPEPPPASAIPPTNTDVPAVIDTPVPATTTPAPTFTPIPPTATLVPPTMTAIPTTGDAAPPATILYPNGRLAQLYYDAYSFYLWNGGTDSLRISSIGFEALDLSGTPTGYFFEGTRWSQFWHSVESGKCNAVEVNNAPGLLKPSQCRGYNAFVNPDPTDPMVFWVPRDNVAQFRVLWSGQEIGRCEISAGFCAVWLP